MPDFSKGLIYKLTCLDPNIKEIYVGSTTNFKQRKKAHKRDCNKIDGKPYNTKVYTFIRNNGGWINWNMVLIKYFSCNTRLELFSEEDKIMRDLNATLNSENAIQHPEEYKQYQKQYYKDNKNKYIENTKKKYG